MCAYDSSLVVVVFIPNGAREAEIANLHVGWGKHKNITRGQIAVYEAECSGARGSMNRKDLPTTSSTFPCIL